MHMKYCLHHTISFAGVGHFWRIFQREWGVAHQPVLVSENQSDCPFVWYQNIRSASFSFVAIPASDGRTDGRTEFRQQYRALHYMQSHGNKMIKHKWGIMNKLGNWGRALKVVT